MTYQDYLLTSIFGHNSEKSNKLLLKSELK